MTRSTIGTALPLLVLPALIASTASCGGDETRTCQDQCTIGEGMCDDQGEVLECEPDEQGCGIWGEPFACADHQVCDEGECRCELECEPGEPVCADEETLATCAGPDSSGCTFLEDPTPCPEHLRCDANLGVCERDTPPECYELNDCDYEGQMLCVDEIHYRVCIRTSRTRCLMWDGCPTCAPSWEECPAGTQCVQREDTGVCE